MDTIAQQVRSANEIDNVDHVIYVLIVGDNHFDFGLIQ